MPNNIVTSTGEIQSGDDLSLRSPRQYKGYLERALTGNGWNCSETDSGNGGYLKYRLTHSDGTIKDIHVYLKPVVWRNRHIDEKAAQMSGNLDMRGFDAGENGEPLYVFGIYRDPTSSGDPESQEDSYVICSWLPTEWGSNRGHAAYNYFIRTDVISRAFKIGFSSAIEREKTVYAFRPESLYYYLINQDELHRNEEDVQETINVQEEPSSFPLNQILYGPPGTGKTYTTIEKAVQIAGNMNTDGLDWSVIKSKYDEYVQSNNIRFVTFHQSYSYEEFVEGIKPVIDENGNISYKVTDGVFKQLCNDALKPLIVERGDQFENRDSNFTVTTINNQSVTIQKDDGSIIVFPTDLILNLFKLIQDGVLTIQSITDRTHNDIHISDYFDVKYDRYIFGQNSVLKPFIEFLIEKNEDSVRSRNFVLIIDEINRGNISRIFGELITLLEDTKRLGKPEALTLKLTYSGQQEGSTEFGVPSNVYIIGTMNSADRSIALIDTALRRRFTFYNYPSKSNLISDNIEGINVRLLFETMNKRIEFLLDSDHLLGHGYFMHIDSKPSLASTFRNKILPLLEEYFYGDFEKIQLILGDNPEYGKRSDLKIIDSSQSSTQRTVFGTDIEGFEAKTLHVIREDMTSEDFDSIPVEVFKSIYGDFPPVRESSSEESIVD